MKLALKQYSAIIPTDNVRNLLMTCIGEKNGITREEFIEALVPDFWDKSEIEQHFLKSIAHSRIYGLKQKGFVVVTKNGLLFMPTKMSDLDEFYSTSASRIRSIELSIERATIFVKEKKWKDLK